MAGNDGAGDDRSGQARGRRDRRAVDGRDEAAIRANARARASFYTGDDWDPDAGGPGTAILDLFSELAAGVVERLDQVPDKHRAAFVNALGFDRRPPQPAELPLTVEIADGAGGNVHIPRGTRALAGATETRPELTYEFADGFEATPAGLDRLVSVNPRLDHVSTHKAALDGTGTATLFSGPNEQRHHLYLGHPDLLTLDGGTTVQIRMASTAAASTLAALEWEYYGETPDDVEVDERWRPIVLEDWAPRGPGPGVLAGGLASLLPPDPREPTIEVDDVVAILDDHGFELTTDDETAVERWLVSTVLTRERDDPVPAHVDPRRQPAVVDLYRALEGYVRDVFEAFPPETGRTLSPVTLTFSIPKPFVETEVQGIESNWIRARVPADSSPTFLARFQAATVQDVTLAAGRRLDEGPALGPSTGEPPQAHGPLIFGTPAFTEAQLFAGSYLAGWDFAGGYSGGGVFDGVITDGGAGDGQLGIPPDDLLANDVPLAVPDPADSDEFVRPFGTLPSVQDAFYVASKEAFTKAGELVTLEFRLVTDLEIDPDDDLNIEPVLSWEYWNGSAWEYLDVDVDDPDVESFLDSGEVTFVVPEDLETTTVSGHEGHWIRARLVGRGYGDIEVDNRDSEKDVWQKLNAVAPPEIHAIGLTYEAAESADSGDGGGGDGESDEGPPGGEVPRGLVVASPEQCYTDNNLAVAAVDPASRFRPFEGVPEDDQTLYFGFDGPLEGGPLQVFVDLAEFQYPPRFRTRVRWEVSTDAGWQRVSVQDGTEGLTERGVVRFSPPTETVALSRFGLSRHWLRARVTAPGGFVGAPYRRRRSARGDGDEEHCGDHLPTTPPGSDAAMALPKTDLVAHNTGLAANVRTVEGEILGSSDGEPDQQFQAASPPVRDATVWVEELATLSAGQRKTLSSDPTVTVEVVGEEPDPDAFWVQWTEVENFLQSDPADRHYTLDAIAGTVTFGDGNQGAVPPRARDNIRISYKTGGGTAGNVPAGAVEELEGSLAFVDSVTNYLPGDGGADVETDVLDRVARQIRDRDRAVAPVDFERIALTSTRKLARAECLPGLDPRGTYQPGWVTVLIVPRSTARKPVPSATLKEQVTASLRARAPASLLGDLGEERLLVRGPNYVEATVEATLVATSKAESFSRVEASADEAMTAFLHPLSGGEDGDGWPFGDLPCVSDCFGVLEGVGGVDHVEDLVLTFEADGMTRTVRPGQDAPSVDPDVLIHSGVHDLDVVGGP